MSKIVVAILTATVTLAAGQVAGPLRFTLTPTVGDPISQDANAVAVEFDNVAPGDYTVTAARLDATGAVIGDAVSGSVTVPAPLESTDVPVSITLTLA